MPTTRTWVSTLRRQIAALDAPADLDAAEEDERVDPEVLNSGFTEREFEEELNRREEVLKELEGSIVRHASRYESFLEKAVEKKGDRRIRFLLKAKKEEIKHDVKNGIYDNLMRQQLFLVKLLLLHKKKTIANAAENFDFAIDVGELPTEEMIGAISEESDQQQEVRETIEELETELGINAEETLGVDLSDIEAEAEELEAAEISEETLSLSSSVDELIEDSVADEWEELTAETDGGETEAE